MNLLKNQQTLRIAEIGTLYVWFSTQLSDTSKQLEREHA
jgi:hypothetical protein